METGPSIEQVKAGMRAAWMAGDFGVVAQTISGGGEGFVGGLPITPGMRVLDVACGTGNVALPAARRGAQVTGVDIAPNSLAQARERAASAGLAIVFHEGDAEQLPYADQSFDAVLTMFGAMFAPRPELVTAEFARVLRPGGLLAMASWTPTSLSGQMFAVNTRHLPPPPGLAVPVFGVMSRPSARDSEIDLSGSRHVWCRSTSTFPPILPESFSSFAPSSGRR